MYDEYTKLRLKNTLELVNYCQVGVGEQILHLYGHLFCLWCLESSSENIPSSLLYKQITLTFLLTFYADNTDLSVNLL